MGATTSHGQYGIGDPTGWRMSGRSEGQDELGGRGWPSRQRACVVRCVVLWATVANKAAGQGRRVQRSAKTAGCVVAHGATGGRRGGKEGGEQERTTYQVAQNATAATNANLLSLSL